MPFPDDGGDGVGADTAWSSPNADARPADMPVDMLVIHYTGMENTEVALARLCAPRAKVSAHYLVDEDGSVYQLVVESARAWHAGEACWRGWRDINGRSIGVELANPGHEFGYRSFPEAQMAALESLVSGILARHPIPPRNVVGHADVAPRRRQDPGELFDWPRLARAGIGVWPAAMAQSIDTDEADVTIAAMLADYGYEVEDLEKSIAAFQRHFRPARIDGVGDGETAAILAALLKHTA